MNFIIDFAFEINASDGFIEINFPFFAQFIVFGVFLSMCWHVLLVDTDIIQKPRMPINVSLIKTIERAHQVYISSWQIENKVFKSFDAQWFLYWMIWFALIHLLTVPIGFILVGHIFGNIESFFSYIIVLAYCLVFS